MRTLLVLLMVGSAGLTHGQSARERYTIRFESLTLADALVEISAATGFGFTYSDDVVPVEAVVSLSAENADIRQVMFLLLGTLPVDYRISARRIILRKTEAPLVHVVSGRVTDNLGAPIPGASVIIKGMVPLLGTSTGADGRFRLEKIPAGRVTVQISSVGYETKLLHDLLLGTGKELVLPIVLSEWVTPIGEVQVVDSRGVEENIVENGAFNSAFSADEAGRFAGSLSDPARMAASFAGVTSASDESNALIIRGNSPRGLLWRIEGIEVPNPNHFSAEGSSSGVIGMLSPNIVEGGTLMKGAFGPSYGNALSGVLDIQLREGNTTRREHSVQAGSLGLEFSTEGPFSRKGNNSYLANYRYSTLNLLEKAGVELEGVGQYADYQDLAAHAVVDDDRAGTFKVFGIAGRSVSRRADLSVRDEDMSRTAITGLTHRVQLTENMSLSSALSWSATHITNERQIDHSPGVSVLLSENYQKQFLRGAVTADRRFGSSGFVSMGAIATRLTYDFYLRNLDPSNTTYAEIFHFRESGNTAVQQAFVSVRQTLFPGVRAVYGIHYIRFSMTDDQSLEPRARINVAVARNGVLSFMGGKHSRIENLQFYLARDHQAGGNEVKLNQNLGFTRSNHFGTAYAWAFRGVEVTAEAYYQRLYNAPLRTEEASWYSAINEDNGFITDSLANSGNGRNYGVEFSVERKLTRGFYYLANATVYQSKFGSGGTAERNTIYNGNYIAHVLGGREFRVGKYASFSVNGKVTYGGGRRYTPVDLARSLERGYQVLDWSRSFEARLPRYFRADVQFGLRTNRAGYSSEFRLDIQNVTHHRNTAYFYFDANSGTIREKHQVGILPVLTWRIDF